MTSIPSLNVTPRTSFGNCLWPSRRRQLFCAPSTSLKTMASAVPFDRQPFDRMVRWRTVAKVLSSILAQAVGRLLVFERVALDGGVERQLDGDLRFGHPDLLQRALGFWLLAFRQLGEHVCSLVHQAALLARFRPDLAGGLPEAECSMTSRGGTSSPRRFRSSSKSRQSCALSRAPSVKPTSSLRPSGVAPISTRMHCFSSSSRTSRWMPSAQM